MTEKTHVKETHRATVSMAGEPYAAKVGDVTVALSDRAMILEEVNGDKAYTPVVYFPLDDITPETLEPTDHSTYCPIKGNARYFTVKANGNALENAAWSYPEPLRQVGAVKNYVAFYPDKVSVERV
jgi:uncharacterized protein (DUF427 family)